MRLVQIDHAQRQRIAAHGARLSCGDDEIARGHRAMAMLLSIFAGLTILLGAFAIDMFHQPFMTMNSILATLLAALVIPFLIYLPLDRHISRLEEERAGAASKNPPES